MSATVLDRLRARLASLDSLRRDVAVAFAGHLTEKTLAAFAGILILYALDPSDYGIYTSALAAFAIVARFTDFGLDTGSMRAVAKGQRAGDSLTEARTLRAVFLAKLVLSAASVAAGWLSAPLVAEWLGRPWFVPFLRLAYLGVFGKQLTGFYRSYFAGRLQFAHNAAFLALIPGLQLVGLVAGYLIAGLNVQVCLGMAVLAPAGACVLATLWVGGRFLRVAGAATDLTPLRGIWSFGRWVYVAELLGSLRTHLSSLLLFGLATSTVTGVYGAGDRLASIASIVANTLVTVFVPRASSLHEPDELRDLLRRSNRWMLVLLAGVPLTPLLARPVVSLLKPQYLPATSVFAVLMISMLISTTALPSRTVLYSLKRPDVECWVELLAVVLSVTLCVALIPDHGAMGAAIAMLVQRVLSTVIIVVAANRVVRSAALVPM